MSDGGRAVPGERLEAARERFGDTNRVEEEESRGGGASESFGEEKRGTRGARPAREGVGDDVRGVGEITREVEDV